MTCTRHRGDYWRPGCAGCQRERADVLASVQSCTVRAPDQGEQLSDGAAAAILDLVALDRELRGV